MREEGSAPEGEDVAWADGTVEVVGSRLLEDRLWIYRLEANPGMPRGGIVPPAPVLAPGSALGSRPRVALSSAQVPAVYRGPRPPGNAGAGSAARTSGQQTPPGTAGQEQERVLGPSPRGGSLTRCGVGRMPV